MNNEQNQIFRYNGSSISFQKGDSVMVNATEMAKPFKKSATHWLRNQSTKDFIKEYAALRNRNPSASRGSAGLEVSSDGNAGTAVIRPRNASITQLAFRGRKAGIPGTNTWQNGTKQLASRGQTLGKTGTNSFVTV